MTFLGTMFCLVLTAFYDAYVLQKMWIWFVVPFGIVSIGKAHAYGLMLILSLVTYTDTSTLAKDKEYSQFGRVLITIGNSFLITTLIWFSASVTHYFMVS